MNPAPPRLRHEPRYQRAFEAERAAVEPDLARLRARVLEEAAATPVSSSSGWALPAASASLLLVVGAALLMAEARPHPQLPEPLGAAEPPVFVVEAAQPIDEPVEPNAKTPHGRDRPGIATLRAPSASRKAPPIGASPIEPATPGGLGETDGTKVGPSASSSASTSEETTENEPTAALASPALGGNEARATGLDDLAADLEAYEEARTQLEAKDYEAARRSLTRYLETHPHGRLRLEAELDLLSCLVLLEDRDQALNLAHRLLDTGRAPHRREELTKIIRRLETAPR